MKEKIEKVYVVNDDFDAGCGGFIIVGIILLGIWAIFKNLYDEAGVIGVIFLIVRIVLIIFLIIFIIHKIGKHSRIKYQKEKRELINTIIEIYKNNNPEYSNIISQECLDRRIILDNENKLILLFTNDDEGFIFKLPFSEFRSYEVSNTENTIYDVKITIKTNLDDPDWSIIEFSLNSNIADLDGIYRDFEYVIGRQLKGDC